MRQATLWGLILLVLAAVSGVPVAAQGCDDCREIKKELRGAALDRTTSVAGAPSTAPVVRAVLYWAEGCGHCHEVLDRILPKMQQKYGPQLDVQLIEVVSLEDISAFYDVAEGYGFARGRAAVPFLLIGDRTLMSVEQIERELPGLIEKHLAAGGVGWPDRAARNATPELAAATIGICGIAAPCESDVAASSGAPVSGAAPVRDRLAPLLATVGLAAVAGGSLAFFLGRRVFRRRTRSAAR